MGVKGLKVAQNEKILSVEPYISGIIYHMIFTYGTHVCLKGNIRKHFIHFFQNFDFQDH